MTSDTRICALADCTSRFVPTSRQRYCSPDCRLVASRVYLRVWLADSVLYPPSMPTAQHVCVACRRAYETQFHRSRFCSLACADTVPA